MDLSTAPPIPETDAQLKMLLREKILHLKWADNIRDYLDTADLARAAKSCRLLRGLVMDPVTKRKIVTRSLRLTRDQFETSELNSFYYVSVEDLKVDLLDCIEDDEIITVPGASLERLVDKLSDCVQLRKFSLRLGSLPSSDTTFGYGNTSEGFLASLGQCLCVRDGLRALNMLVYSPDTSPVCVLRCLTEIVRTNTLESLDVLLDVEPADEDSYPVEASAFKEALAQASNFKSISLGLLDVGEMFYQWIPQELKSSLKLKELRLMGDVQTWKPRGEAKRGTSWLDLFGSSEELERFDLSLSPDFPDDRADFSSQLTKFIESMRRIRSLELGLCGKADEEVGNALATLMMKRASLWDYLEVDGVRLRPSAVSSLKEYFARNSSPGITMENDGGDTGVYRLKLLGGADDSVSDGTGSDESSAYGTDSDESAMDTGGEGE